MSRQVWQQPRGDLLGLPQTLFDSTEELIARPPIHLRSTSTWRHKLPLIHAESESEDLSAKLRNEHRVQKQAPQSLDRDMDPRVLAKEKSEILLKRPRSIMQFGHLLEELEQCFEELPVQPPGASTHPNIAEFNTNVVAAEPASKDHVKVGTFTELLSSILSRLDRTQHVLEHLQASQASKDDVKAMLDKRFENQSALLENMLLKFKYIEKVDVEHDLLEADQRRSVNIKHIENMDVEHVQLEADQNGSSKRKSFRSDHRSDQGQTDVEDEEEAGERKALEIAHRTSVNEWCDFQDRLNSEHLDADDGALLTQFFEKGGDAASFDVLPRNILRWLGFEHWLPAAMPDTCLARVLQQWWFQALEFFLIISGTITMAIEANQTIQASLQSPREEPSVDFFFVNVFFNAAYAVVVLYHICAARSWFLLSSDWTWNLLDVTVVTISCFSLMTRGVKIGFIRSLRIIKLVRVVRIIKVLRCFRELQVIMLSIYASIASLVWCFVFLAVTMFIFSLFAVQTLSEYFQVADPLASGYEEERELANKWYGSIPLSMWSLTLSCIGWVDFLDAKIPLNPAGIFTQVAFVIYNIFVTVGVMNVLVGVFSDCANDVGDRHLLIQREHMKTEKLVMDLCELFADMKVHTSHSLDWPEFKKKISNPELQAYLASLNVDATHARMLFDLLDDSSKGSLTMQDFVMGMARLSGTAKAIDVRAIQREMVMMPRLIELLITRHINQPASSM